MCYFSVKIIPINAEACLNILYLYVEVKFGTSPFLLLSPLTFFQSLIAYSLSSFVFVGYEFDSLYWKFIDVHEILYQLIL